MSMPPVTTETCRDTYVTTCTPPPPVDLPDCADGWGIGNGTAVCASAPPAPASDLAATGGDPTAGLALSAALLVAGTLTLTARALRPRVKR